MKTKKIIEEIKSMGVQVKELDSEVVIKDGEGYIVAVASKVEFAVLVTDYQGFYRLDNNTKLQLLNLLIKYAKTPIEDREEEEEYYLRHKGLRRGNNILNLEYDSKIYLVSDDLVSNGFKTKFTQSEIDDMPECYTHPAVWERIKVERNQ